jgi:peptidyl-tRNA hydrolase, PTH1 family
MKMIVGLGNPGKEYEKTRHNAGFVVLDAFLQTQKSKLKTPSISADRQNDNLKFKEEKKFGAQLLMVGEVLLVKPMTFMNRSGDAVVRVARFYKIPLEHMCVVHDDLDILWGKHKFQFGVGPKVHNGIYSVEQSLGSKEFWRLRVGVDNRNSTDEVKMSGERYVLSRFTDEEMGQMETYFEELLTELKGFINGAL